jgi:uncharacterized protein YjeT (DUF2065 family)
MRNAIAMILGLLLCVNALAMIFAPERWYEAVPGVSGTGPANLHFIRDIGCAYLVAALGVLSVVRAPRQAWPAALASGAFLALHALTHLADAAAGRESGHQLALDLPAIFLPAILALWIAGSARRNSQKE